MTLGANVEFGLAMDRVSRPERHRRAAEALEMVGLGGQQRRRVTELSGGESQRAALARALVKRPALLLLDEPLGALDLKLRQEMQRELVHLKTTTSTTFVHVTHDQEEACAMADRIAVMRDGKIVQIDTPLALYQYPRTAYVATFINSGTLVRGASERHGTDVEIVTPDVTVRGRRRPDLNGALKIAAVIPRDRVEIHPPEATPLSNHTCGVTGTVERVAFTGSVFDVALRVSDDLLVAAALHVEDMKRFTEPLHVGAPARASWAVDDIILVEDA
jgi:ABC-type Fe3+/spermidine/putrescine transport system ATPase subunit